MAPVVLSFCWTAPVIGWVKALATQAEQLLTLMRAFWRNRRLPPSAAVQPGQRVFLSCLGRRAVSCSRQGFCLITLFSPRAQEVAMRAFFLVLSTAAAFAVTSAAAQEIGPDWRFMPPVEPLPAAHPNHASDCRDFNDIVARARDSALSGLSAKGAPLEVLFRAKMTDNPADLVPVLERYGLPLAAAQIGTLLRQWAKISIRCRA
jgi:hypothetical protein